MHEAHSFLSSKAIWVYLRFPLIPSFQHVTDAVYKARVQNVDLCNQAEGDKEEVNSWAEKETKGLIKEIVPQKLKLVPPLHLANLLYFKGAWEHAFHASWTQHNDFHLLNGETIKDPFMTTSWVISPTSMIHLRISSLSSSHLRYTNTSDKQFSIYIFLPHTRNELKDLIEKFNLDTKFLQPNRFYLQCEELSEVWISKITLSYNF